MSGPSIDPDVERLATKIIESFSAIPDDRRLLVAIAGPPGSGKSTLAYPLTAHVNSLLLHRPEQHTQTDTRTGLTHIQEQAQQGRALAVRVPGDDTAAEAIEIVAAGALGSDHPGEDVAICVGLDGWHYSRAALDGFDDPDEAHYRRGAAFTFDLPSYTSFLSLLTAPIRTTHNPDCPSASIPFPTFSHSLKDPLPSPLPILPSHRIIIIEGLYTMLDRPGWRECAEMMDLRVFVQCDERTCRERVLRRNWAAGLTGTYEACEARVDASDMVNGTEVRTHLYKPTDIITPQDTPEQYA